MDSPQSSPQALGMRAAICLLCDENYLFPALAVARQAKQSTPDADVYVFTNLPTLVGEARAMVEARCGVFVRPVPQHVLDRIDAGVPEGFFARTYLAKPALYRLFLAEMLEQRYDRILYLDGDMQVYGSLQPLLTAPLPEGHVAAVRDWLAMHLADGLPYAEENVAYMTKLGLEPAQFPRYFNSGMVLGSHDTWALRGAEAFRFLVANPERCRRHDQSALNYVCRDHLTQVSVRWNYLRPFMPLPAFKALAPRIIHFVGLPKPWDGVYAPWGKAEHAVYRELATLLDGAGIHWRKQSLLRRVAYHFKPYIKRDKEFADPEYRRGVNAMLMQDEALV